jgi:hypothetical protein
MFFKKIIFNLFYLFNLSFGMQMTLQGNKILLDGVFLNKGTPAEGLLLNSRMVQGISDGYSNFKYPDTNIWNATRNNQEFIQGMCLWKNKGLNGFTIGLQGGAPKIPVPTGYKNTLFRSDGSLKQDYLNRLQLILEQSRNLKMIVIVSFFYRTQVGMFGNYNNALIGFTNMLKWLKSHNYHQHIIIEPVNECEFSEFSSVGLSCNQNIVNLLKLAKSYGFFAGNSLKGGVKPPDSIIDASSIILVHGNGISSNSGYKSLVDNIKKSSKYRGQPIIFNEAGENSNYLDYCVSIGVSWGYYSQGSNNYVNGYQSPPINWGINTSKKIDFFNKVLKYKV